MEGMSRRGREPPGTAGSACWRRSKWMLSYGGVKEGGTTERDSCASSLEGRGFLFVRYEVARCVRKHP